MTTQAALGLNFVRILRQLKLKMNREFLSDKHMKVIYHAGFPYQAFNGKGQINPWSIVTMVEVCRSGSFNRLTPSDHTFLDMDKLYEQNLVFIVATTTKISPSFYDHALPKAPVEMHSELIHVGKTSFTQRTSLYFEGSDLPVCENETQSVLVDVATRKPNQPPDWWRKKYDVDLEGEQPLKIPRHVVPESGVLSKNQIQIKASDLDVYWHTNWSNYVKFSYDAFVDFAIKKHGPSNIPRAFRKCKNFSVLYMKEANLMDTVDICMWKDFDNSNLFKFQFCNKSSDVISESQLEFYPPDE
ncbi:hypothetical protein PoB_003792900 [Plakobranchus ocellatus]|uniref:Acyl-ACP thioesterase-like C-terminal domain-containing protein n=1 Tax=Plakobranchus ocellatus TaxID=259542 RepID=A0AAV4AYH6_9GAST|nr:hypothetical protein PoB_003792900 [Plakobranchus ocellatus]